MRRSPVIHSALIVANFAVRLEILEQLYALALLLTDGQRMIARGQRLHRIRIFFCSDVRECASSVCVFFVLVECAVDTRPRKRQTKYETPEGDQRSTTQCGICTVNNKSHWTGPIIS